jgi:hypothetical protein
LLGLHNASSSQLDLLGLAVGPDESVAAAIARARSLYDHDHLAVLLDTSTVRNAMQPLTGGAVGPLQLLDLSLFVQAVACHDVVLIPRGEADPFAFVDGLPPVFVSLKFTREEAAHTLWSLCNEANTRKPLERRLADDWREFLNLTDPPRIKLDEFSEYQDSPHDWDGVPATYYTDWTYAGVVDDRKSRDRFLSIQTFRTLFNDRLASLMNEPYWASSFRAPVTSILIREKAQTRETLDSLFASIGHGQGAPATSGPYLRRVSLPPLTSVLLQDLETIEEFWLGLEDLRARMTPFRDAVRHDRAASQGNGSRLLERYAKALADASGRVVVQGSTKLAQDSAEQAIGVAVATTSLPAPAAGAVAKVLAAIGGEVFTSVYERLSRPDVHVMGNLAVQAQRLVGLEHQLKRLWRTEWKAEQHEQLVRLASAQPQRFLALPSGN